MDADEPLGTLAFGSCRKQNRSQPIWAAVAALKPDAFVWLGDYVYGGKYAATPAELASYYAKAAEVDAPLRASTRVIDGVYDDHDYGENDAGMRYPHREAARRLFLDAVGAPADSPRRTQSGGLYGARTFGTPPRQVKLVMLDTRYARDDHVIPSVGASRWLPKPGYFAGALRALCAAVGYGREHPGDMLGSEAQWQWLEDELLGKENESKKTSSSVVPAATIVLSTLPVLGKKTPLFCAIL